MTKKVQKQKLAHLLEMLPSIPKNSRCFVIPPEMATDALDIFGEGTIVVPLGKSDAVSRDDLGLAAQEGLPAESLEMAQPMLRNKAFVATAGAVVVNIKAALTKMEKEEEEE